MEQIELDVNIEERIGSAINTDTGRLLVRQTRIARRRPDPPRNVKKRAIGSYFEITWEPPRAGVIFDGYRVRKDTDAGLADAELAPGHTATTFLDGTSFYVSTFISKGFESVPIKAQ